MGPILLTGATGQVGGALLRVLGTLGEVASPDRSVLDLSNATSVRKMIRAVRPRWIVNPGAYTAVDKAESEPELAYAVNAEAVRAIGEEAHSVGAVVIHFSTDYVFDGSGTRAYTETDATGPVSVYGASKLAGENALAESGAAYMTFRTSWVYGATGKNFLLTILKLAREREVLRVVGDQYGAPTWSKELADMTIHVIRQCEAAAASRDLPEMMEEFRGIYHASGAGETTWCGFASEALRLLKEKAPAERFAEIRAIPTIEYPTPAKRPANSRMNCGKLAERFSWKMMEWQESLQRVLSEL